jgi:hypothetical protein
MISSSHLLFFHFNWWASLGTYIVFMNFLLFLLFTVYRGCWLWRSSYCYLTIIQLNQVSQPFLLMIRYAPLICLGAGLWIQLTEWQPIYSFILHQIAYVGKLAKFSNNRFRKLIITIILAKLAFDHYGYGHSWYTLFFFWQ